MAKFTEMDHVKNADILWQLLAIISDRYLDNRTFYARDNKTPKDLILIWDTGE